MNDNRHLYDRNYYKASLGFQANPKRIDYFVKLIKSYNPLDVLDVGCGLGTLVKKLQKEKINAIGLDFAPDLRKYFWKNDFRFIVCDARRIAFPDSTFDLVFSADFFEHIDEEDIDKVAKEMKRVGKGKVITFVADDRGPINRRQRIRHVTHKSMDWWKDKLKDIEVFSSHDAV